MTAGLTLEGPGLLPAAGRPRSAAEVAEVVREAHARRTRLRIVGAGTWLDAGAPVLADAVLSLADCAGILDYTPGDLTLTAAAGTPLSVIVAATATEGQLLPLDPAGSDAGTFGATIATASSGPLAHAFGTPRDLVLGAAIVTGSGALLHAGGRVVKNVAGFDLVRLHTGAWGTLGVFAEVSVRLRALPEVEVTLAVPLPPVARLADWLDRLRIAAVPAWALELVNAPLIAQLGISIGERRGVLLARLAGNEPLVREAASRLATLGDVTEVPGDVWHRLRNAEPRTATVLRRSARPTRLAALAAELFSPAAGAFGLLAHASVERGVVRLILPGDTGFGLPSVTPPRAAPDARPIASTIVERLPAALWPTLGPRLAPPRTDDLISQRLRAAFDPHGILNPGIMG